MSETYSETRDGITVTVWLSLYGNWLFIATRGDKIIQDSVKASNRTEAVEMAFDIAVKELQ